jgi:hypothetical protein
VQVAQATLPFGQSAMVYDPVTYTYTAPYKQILRVRLLLHAVETTPVCSSKGNAGLFEFAVANPSVSRRELTHPPSSSCSCSLLVCGQWTAGVVVVNQSERCLPEYLITFK